MGSVEYVHMVIVPTTINPMHPLVMINKSLSQSYIVNNLLTLVNALPFLYVYLLLEGTGFSKIHPVYISVTLSVESVQYEHVGDACVFA